MKITITTFNINKYLSDEHPKSQIALSCLPISLPLMLTKFQISPLLHYCSVRIKCKMIHMTCSPHCMVVATMQNAERKNEKYDVERTLFVITGHD